LRHWTTSSLSKATIPAQFGLAFFPQYAILNMSIFRLSSLRSGLALMVQLPRRSRFDSGRVSSVNDTKKTLAFPVGGRAGSYKRPEDAPENTALSHILKGVAALPDVLELLLAQGRQIEALREEIKALRIPQQGTTADGWMDAKAAAKYLGISAGSFDKYRYKTTPRIKGYNLDGKTLYKKKDLDDFVMLYEIKSQGLA